MKPQQRDLFLDVKAPPAIYPDVPGFKVVGPSQQAAEAIKPRAETLRDRVLAALKSWPRTADEVAYSLGESVLSIRPRLSELRVMGLIDDTGETRLNESKKSATVWRATP